MSDSDEETQSNKGSPPYGEEEENQSDEEIVDGEFPPINSGPNELDDVEVSRNARNRVKLYVLCEQRTWDDRGTGHVACVQLPNSNIHVLIVRLEAAEKNVLESKILLDTVYQKQQETLIVWSESDSCDLALSFQEKTGCEEIWTKICEVQGKDPTDTVSVSDSSFEEPEEGDDSLLERRIRIPPILKEKLHDLDRAITYHLQNNERREKMSNAIEKDEMIPKIIEIFIQSEEQNDITSLHFLYNITKNCILMNRTNVHDILFEDQYLREVIGMLEYDPAHETPRKHREFLYEKAQFKEVLPIPDKEIKDKIHKVYRVQYIQDVCLPAPSLFEENLMGALNSYLFFLRVDICTGLQSNEEFMGELFEQLKSNDITLSRRRDLVQFLKEFLALSQSFPASGCQQKDNILKGLFNCDILGTVEPCLHSSDPIIKNTIIDLLNRLTEHNPQLVREYFLKQARGKDQYPNEILLNQLLEAMHSDMDVELSCANQVSNIVRTLLDMDKFLHLFYNTAFRVLVRPLLENVEAGHLRRDDYHTANSSALVIKMLCFCIETHAFNMRTQVVTHDLMNKVLIGLKSKHHFLVLAALKMLRSVVGQKDDYYLRYLVREKVVDKVIDCFHANGNRYNLLNSAILEFFEYCRSEDLRVIIKYTIEEHYESLCDIDYVPTFKQMKQRYDLVIGMSDGTKSTGRNSVESIANENLAQHFEDQWLEAEDDELENPCDDEDDEMRRNDLLMPSLLKRKNAFDDDDADSVFSNHFIPNNYEKKAPIVIKMNEDRSRTPSPSLHDDEVTSSQNGKSPSPGPSNRPESLLKVLVDYEGSSSDDEEEENSNSADSVPSSSTGSPDSAKKSNSAQSRSPNGDDSVSSTSGDSDESMRGLKRQMSSDFGDGLSLEMSSKRIKPTVTLTNGHSSDHDLNPDDINSSDLLDLSSFNAAEAREAMLKDALKRADPIYCRVEDYGLLNNVEERPELSNGDD